MSPEEAISRGLISPDELEEIRDSAHGRIQEVQETSDGKFRIQEEKEYKVISLDESKTEEKKAVESIAVESIEDKKSPSSPEKLSKEASPERRKSPVKSDVEMKGVSEDRVSPAKDEPMSDTDDVPKQRGSPVKGEPSPRTSPVKDEPSPRTSPVKGEPSPRGSPVKEEPSIKSEPSPRTSPVKEKPSPRGSPVKDEPSPRTSPVKSEPSPRVSPVKGEPSPRTSPLKEEPSPRASPVKGEPSPRSSPVKDELSPRTSPVKSEPSPRESPIKEELSPLKGEPSPRVSPVKEEPSPRASPVKGEPSPVVSPVKGEPSPRGSPVKSEPSPMKEEPLSEGEDVSRSSVSPVKGKPSPGMSPVQDEPSPQMDGVSRPGESPVKDRSPTQAMEKKSVTPTSGGESPEEPQTERKMSLGERTRERVTTEPKFSVAIGRAKSLPSPSHEGKPVVLQKVRRKSMKPKQAASKGVVDEKTASLLDDLSTLRGHGGEPLSLEEALRLKKVDGDSGAIVDISCGEPLTINEAVESGILDSSTGSVLVPIGRSVSVPEAVSQGLFDKTAQRFIHPETGDLLTLHEAVLCDVIDPVSQIVEPDTNEVMTLDEAIKRGLIDSDSGQITTKRGPVSILEAIDSDVFVTTAVARVDWLPPLGMTFPVALERGLVDADTKEIIHPVTSDRQLLKNAIENNFILALPCPILPDSVQVTQALECKLINTDSCTFTVPSTGEEIPVEKAIESGMLQIKPMTTVVADEKEERMVITETVTSYETIITKTVRVKAGYVMVSQNEVKNTTTGEILPIEEAKNKGIVVETEEEEVIKEKPTFREAMEQGQVDFASGTYKNPRTKEEVPIAEAIQQGLVQPMDPTPSKEVTSKINIMEAFSTIYHEKSGKFKDPVSGNLLSLDEAVEKGVIDPDAMVYDTKRGDALTTKEAVEKGVIDVEAGDFIDPKSGSKIKVKDAVKMGLLAVIGAPVLAGMAVKEVIKGACDKAKRTSSPSRTTTVVTEIVEEYVSARTAEEMLRRPSIRPEDQRCYPIIKIGQKMTLRRAMEECYIDVDLCVVVVPSNGSRQLLRRAVVEGSITFTSVIEIRTRTEIWIVEEITIITEVVRSLDPAIMTEKGEFDPKGGKFIDPETKKPITFKEAVEKCSLSPDHTVVTDPTSGKEITLTEAIKEGVVDPTTGEVKDPQMGSAVPFFEAVKKDLVKPDDKKEPKKEQEKPDTTSLTISEAISSGILKPETGMLTNPTTGESMVLGQAIQSGLIDPTSIKIIDPRSEDTVSLKEAVETGLIDVDSATFTDPETGCEVEFTTALMKGILVPKRKPMSLVAVVKKDLYDPKTGKIADTLMKQKLEVDEAVKRGIVDPFITYCLDTKANKYVTLDEALDTDLIVAQNGKLKHTKKNNFITFDTAVQQELIVTKRKPVPLTEAVVSDMYEPQSGLFYDPCEGMELTLNSSLSCKLIDGSPCRVKVNEELYTVSDALDKTILDGEAGQLLQPSVMSLDEAVRRGHIVTAVGSLSLQQVLEDGLYDPETGLITVNDDRITIKEAIERNIIDPSSMSVKDPRTGEPLSLEEAIRVGIIDPDSGTFRDPVTGADVELTEALAKGMIIEGRTKFTLYQTVIKGLYNPSTGRITAPNSQDQMTVSRAIRSGLVNTNTTLARDPDTEQLMSFKQAVSRELIDINAGVMKFGRIKRVNFKDAFEQDYLLEAQVPMALRVVIMKELYSEETGRFLNPTTGSWVTLSEALSVQMIDPDSTHVKDTLSGRLKKVNLREAVEANIIDGETALVKNHQSGTWHTLLEAYELMLIVDSRVAMSLQRALHQGLVDDEKGVITDVNTGRKITLHEAMRRLVINPSLPCYLDHSTSSCLSLVQTCREGIIDRRLGKFIDPKSGCTLTLMDALEHGMILDIDKPQDLHAAVTMGFCDSKTGRMIQPNTGRRLTLADACKQNIVDPSISIIRAADKPKFMKLNAAVKEGLIDDIKGKYVIPGTSEEISLEEAAKQSLILPAKRPLTVEEALQYCLYSPETGRFTEPSIGDKMDLQEAITHGLIDGNTSALINPSDNSMKSIRSAIEDKDIDVTKGVVIHPQTKKEYTINIAFEKGFIVTVGKPISFMQAVKQGSIDFEKGSYTDPETSIQYTLEEALRFELIDPDSAVIKDPNTGRYKTLKRAIQEGLVDLKKRALYDPQSGTLKTLCIIFDQGTIVFLREPLSFDEAIDKGHLNTETGMYTDPNSKEIMTINETCRLGLIDPQTVLIKNTRYRQLLQPAEACQVGALENEKGKVYNMASNQMLTIAAAMDAGLIVTPRRGLALLEALDYNLYDPDSGRLLNPHVKEHVTLKEAIACGLVDTTTTMVKCPAQGTIQTMCDAIRSGVLDEQGGAVVDTAQGTSYPLPEARRLGYLLTAQARVRCTSNCALGMTLHSKATTANSLCVL
ncbi:Muscle M-line assembly protein unc-89 [Portunus trituberculatus]|uniref:Muscle M-line assembly protein unc-89 n=1 Tax=Portunus trituberculatus TaxID=210409 RepID=A0A5B7CHN0_PORTR|nr:Muscle M-line assembly protein unc-89 [Portunus trituberculatus]